MPSRRRRTKLSRRPGLARTLLIMIGVENNSNDDIMCLGLVVGINISNKLQNTYIQYLHEIDEQMRRVQTRTRAPELDNVLRTIIKPKQKFIEFKAVLRTATKLIGYQDVTWDDNSKNGFSIKCAEGPSHIPINSVRQIEVMTLNVNV